MASMRRVVRADGGGLSGLSRRPMPVAVTAIGRGMRDPASATAGAVTRAAATTRSGRSTAYRSAYQPPSDAPTSAACWSPSASSTDPTNAAMWSARSRPR